MFGEVVSGEVHLSEIGRIVREEWLASAEIRAEVQLDAFVVMPNHSHANVRIDDGEHRHRLLPRPYNDGTPSRTLSDLVVGFKSATTRRANIARQTPGLHLWQRGFHERVIRNDTELARVRQYIADNPRKWEATRTTHTISPTSL